MGDDGKLYDVDGIDDKLTKISNLDDQGVVYDLYKFKTTCIDDLSSAWLESYAMSIAGASARPAYCDGRLCPHSPGVRE